MWEGTVKLAVARHRDWFPVGDQVQRWQTDDQAGADSTNPQGMLGGGTERGEQGLENARSS